MMFQIEETLETKQAEKPLWELRSFAPIDAIFRHAVVAMLKILSGTRCTTRVGTKVH